MKNFLNKQNIDRAEKLEIFKKYVAQYTLCYNFSDAFVSKDNEWAVLYFNGLYKLQIDSNKVSIIKSSGMKNCSWEKCFEKNQLIEIINFIASELNIFPIN